MVIENIASSKTPAHAQAINDSGGVPILMRLLAGSSASLRVAQWAFRALSHLVDLPDRDALLNTGIGPIILKLLSHPLISVS